MLLHAHDWHTALAPVYLRTTLRRRAPRYDAHPTVLSVHNAGYQGHFPPRRCPSSACPGELYNWRQLEWYGKVNFLKGGLVFADASTTVSPTHARELRTPGGGFGLHEVFIVAGRPRSSAILNGIDQQAWDPATDPQITAPYSRRGPRRQAALQGGAAALVRPAAAPTRRRSSG